MYAVWGAAAMLVLVGEVMLFGAWNAIKTVGKDTAPSIIYAQEISFCSRRPRRQRGQLPARQPAEPGRRR